MSSLLPTILLIGGFLLLALTLRLVARHRWH